MSATVPNEILVLRDQSGFIYVLSRDVLDRARAAVKHDASIRDGAGRGRDNNG